MNPHIPPEDRDAGAQPAVRAGSTARRTALAVGLACLAAALLTVGIVPRLHAARPRPDSSRRKVS